MKIATKKDLENLKIGEQIYKKTSPMSYVKYIYQGKVIHENGKTTMRGISESLIIYHGSNNCELIFMGGDDSDFKYNGTFLIGEYDSEFIGNEIIKYLEETFEEGELVEVSDDGAEWHKAGFLMYSTKNSLVYTASISDQNKLKISDYLGVTSYKYVRKIPKTKQITITVTEEQEEKINKILNK